MQSGDVIGAGCQYNRMLYVICNPTALGDVDAHRDNDLYVNSKNKWNTFELLFLRFPPKRNKTLTAQVDLLTSRQKRVKCEKCLTRPSDNSKMKFHIVSDSGLLDNQNHIYVETENRECNTGLVYLVEELENMHHALCQHLSHGFH